MLILNYHKKIPPIFLSLSLSFVYFLTVKNNERKESHFSQIIINELRFMFLIFISRATKHLFFKNPIFFMFKRRLISSIENENHNEYIENQIFRLKLENSLSILVNFSNL